MARFGMFCFLGRGHLDPAAAVGRCLQSRGHDVTVFHLAIAEAAVRSAGLRYWPIDTHDPKTLAHPAGTGSSPPFKFVATVNAVCTHAQRVLREGCAALRSVGVDMVIADQMDVAAGSVAEYLGIPFVNISCGPPVYLDATAPAPYFGWHHAGTLAPIRNWLGNVLMSRALRPVIELINSQRRTWGLQPVRHLNELFSDKAIITQLPHVLELKRSRPLDRVFYTAQFVDGCIRKAVRFPWDRLNGKPLVYASMGTIRNDLPWVFRLIADTAALFDVQLVLSLGGGAVRPTDLGPLPHEAIVVEYAPQIDLIRQSALVINCAGLNTTLDCVASGVPMVALPVAEDQPGIAARIEEAEMGVVIPLRRLTLSRLRDGIHKVLREPSYTSAARRLQLAVSTINGVQTAADIIEMALSRKVSINGRVAQREVV